MLRTGVDLPTLFVSFTGDAPVGSSDSLSLVSHFDFVLSSVAFISIILSILFHEFSTGVSTFTCTGVTFCFLFNTGVVSLTLDSLVCRLRADDTVCLSEPLPGSFFIFLLSTGVINTGELLLLLLLSEAGAFAGFLFTSISHSDSSLV